MLNADPMLAWLHNKALTTHLLWFPRAGMLTALALGLHNFPEGLATFVGTLADPTAGVAIAIAIALHNIPEVAVFRTTYCVLCIETLPDTIFPGCKYHT